MSVLINSVQYSLLWHYDFSRNRSCWYFYLVVSWWSLFICQSSQSGPYFHSCNISQGFTSEAWRQITSPWQKTLNILIHIFLFFHVQTWNWSHMELTHMSNWRRVSQVLLLSQQRRFGSTLPLARSSGSGWSRLCSAVSLSCSCCFRISARTSRTMWSRSTPSWRPSFPWSSCPTPSTLLWTSGWSLSNTTVSKVS